MANGLREKVILEVDGGFRTGRDVVVAALLGAGRFGFGTLPLLALGCKMVRQCHLNTCPTGVATQDLDLRAKYTGAAEQVVSLFTLLADEVRRHLAAIGARTLEEIIGRADLLEVVDERSPVGADLADLLVEAPVAYRHPGFQPVERSAVGDALAADWRAAVVAGDPDPVELSYPVTNRDRAVGTRLAGLVTERHPEGLPDGSIQVRLAGTAGQSLGAFLTAGIDLRLDGTANDYVGKGMGGGRIVIAPRVSAPGRIPHGGGNAVLYGATGGRLFISGTVGQRFAVRNSGATAVVDGCSDHGCEYMTGGTAVILGKPGRNLAAGMTGGVLYVWDPEGMVARHLAETAPSARRPRGDELAALRALVTEHHQETGSERAGFILADWQEQQRRFWILEGAPQRLRAEAGEPVPAATGAG